ncbi:MAG: electron transport complex subunit RsxC [Candidatus Dadabacteria bacterium]|nr:MAG: electron transport complex subunit RsxC [Candidatus Dadabacteria bacterium]
MAARTFPLGGVHPPDEKHRTAAKPVERAPLPELLVVPLSQHIGAPARPVVKRGDRVLAGQVVGEATGFVSVPVHAPTSGKVVRVEAAPHPLGPPQPAVFLEPDGEDAWVDLPGPLDAGADPDEIRRRIQEAGIVGMGGATFPTHVKLSPPPEFPIDTVILNGVECEPYLTADHRLMLEEPERILQGLRIILSVFGLEKGFIGIEENKPDAIDLLGRKAREAGFAEVVPLRVKYPQGAEKQLIKAVTGREVPSGQLPMAVGAVVQNVGTAAAIWDAVSAGRPLVERITTVTGDGVREPKNLRVRIGTPVRRLIEAAGGLRDEPGKLVLGGPMMGIAHHDLDVPAVKGTSGVLVLPRGRVRTAPEGPCIRCGRCVTACPMGLSPTTLRALIARDLVAEADEWNALDCIECGSCAFVCPSAIPLVQAIREAKGRVMARRRKAGS